MSKEVCERFIQDLVKCLNQENERLISGGSESLDVAYLVAPLTQHLSSPQFEEFHQRISSADYGLNYFRTPGHEGYYQEDCVQVVSAAWDGEHFIITFSHDERMWGYCMCSPEDDGYDQKRRCCGNGCDWCAPAFSIEKRRTLGRASFTGIEREYWTYEEEFNTMLAGLNAELDRAKKAQQAQYIRNQITQLQERLKEVEQS